LSGHIIMIKPLPGCSVRSRVQVIRTVCSIIISSTHVQNMEESPGIIVQREMRRLRRIQTAVRPTDLWLLRTVTDRKHTQKPCGKEVVLRLQTVMDSGWKRQVRKCLYQKRESVEFRVKR